MLFTKRLGIRLIYLCLVGWSFGIVDTRGFSFPKRLPDGLLSSLGGHFGWSTTYLQCHLQADSEIVYFPDFLYSRVDNVLLRALSLTNRLGQWVNFIIYESEVPTDGATF